MLSHKVYPAVELSQYIDDAGERPLVRGTDLPVATVAYRALSESWGLKNLCFKFNLTDSQAMAALLYYVQFRDQIDAQENYNAEFEARD